MAGHLDRALGCLGSEDAGERLQRVIATVSGPLGPKENRSSGSTLESEKLLGVDQPNIHQLFVEHEVVEFPSLFPPLSPFFLPLHCHTTGYECAPK